MSPTRFTQRQFDDALAEIIRERSESGSARCQVVARDLHRSVVGGSQPNRMPMACSAMWKLGAVMQHTVLHRTESGRSSSLEIEYALDPPGTVQAPSRASRQTDSMPFQASSPPRPASERKHGAAGTDWAKDNVPDADLYLVGCVKRKKNSPMPARELYASAWFRKARACVERTGRPWAILSAKYGLVWPAETVAPYEKTLESMSSPQRRRWADAVLASLAPHRTGVRTVAMLAGSTYRRVLVQKLNERNIEVLVPMEGLPYGKQLRWMNLCLSRPNDRRSRSPQPRSATGRVEHLRRFYECVAELERRLGGARKLSACSGRMPWPERGVYFFTELGETRSDSGQGPRVVRVGTHGLRAGARSTLWKRLAQHKGTRAGGGNHRSSIFRFVVGTALMARDGVVCRSWNDRRTTPTSHTVNKERAVELTVSAAIGRMPFLWLPVNDEPGRDSLRGYIERNSIALLSNSRKHPLDAPSDAWLGHHCDREKVRASGLWNSDHVDEAYDLEFLDTMARLVDRVGAVRGY